MKLSKVERQILVNQFEILSHLRPGSEAHYRQQAEALQNGFDLAIAGIFEYMFDGLSAEDCRRVLNHMDMYSALKNSFGRLNAPSSVTAADVEFEGYDGNHETAFMSYARYLVEHEQRFVELGTSHDGRSNDFNSHSASLDRYDRMFAAWEGLGSAKFQLDEATIRRLVDIR